MNHRIDAHNLLVSEPEIQHLIELYLNWSETTILANVSRSQYLEMTEKNTIPLWIRLSQNYQKQGFPDHATNLPFSELQRMAIVCWKYLSNRHAENDDNDTNNYKYMSTNKFLALGSDIKNSTKNDSEQDDNNNNDHEDNKTTEELIKEGKIRVPIFGYMRISTGGRAPRRQLASKNFLWGGNNNNRSQLGIKDYNQLVLKYGCNLCDIIIKSFVNDKDNEYDAIHFLENVSTISQHVDDHDDTILMETLNKMVDNQGQYISRFIAKQFAKSVELHKLSVVKRFLNGINECEYELVKTFIQTNMVDINDIDTGGEDGNSVFGVRGNERTHKKSFLQVACSVDVSNEDSTRRKNIQNIVKLLVENGADVNYCIDKKYLDNIKNHDKYLPTALHCACFRKHPNIEIVRLLLNYGADPSMINIHQQTPLMLLCFRQEKKDCSQIIHLLINNDKNSSSNDNEMKHAKNNASKSMTENTMVNMKTSKETHSRSALMLASNENNIEALIENNGNINDKDSDGIQVWWYVLPYLKKESSLKTFMNKNTCGVDIFNDKSVGIALNEANYEGAQFLIDNHPNIQIISKEYGIWRACTLSKTKTASGNLDDNINDRATAILGWEKQENPWAGKLQVQPWKFNPLMNDECRKFVCYLINTNKIEFNKNESSEIKNEMLKNGIECEFIELIKYLVIKQNINVNIIISKNAFMSNEDKKTLLMYIINQSQWSYKPKSVEIVEILIKHGGCNVNAKDVDGNTPLHYCARSPFELSREEMIRRRQQEEEEHEEQENDDDDGNDDEKSAVGNNEKEKEKAKERKMDGGIQMAKLLIENGARIDARNNKGGTAMLSVNLAKPEYSLNFIKLLMSYTGYINSKNVKQDSECRISVKDCDNNGNSILHCYENDNWSSIDSTCGGSKSERQKLCKLIDYLILNKFDFNCCNNDGNTPLIYSMITQCQTMFELLCNLHKNKKNNQCNIDIMHKNSISGDSPVCYTVSHIVNFGNRRSLEILLSSAAATTVVKGFNGKEKDNKNKNKNKSKQRGNDNYYNEEDQGLLLRNIDSKGNNLMMNVICRKEKGFRIVDGDRLVKILQDMLDKYKFDINETNIDNENALLSGIVIDSVKNVESDENGDHGWGNEDEIEYEIKTLHKKITFCIQNGIKINMIDKEGNNAIIKVLKKWEYNLENHEGEGNNIIEVIKLLIDNGCDFKHRNKNGESAISVAQKYGKRSDQIMALFYPSKQVYSDQKEVHPVQS